MSMTPSKIFSRAARWSIAIALSLCFLIGSVGLPTIRSAAKDLSQPFPCQDNPCGCSSAEECWHHCCCHTNQEKVAWAEKHHVTPPQFVVEAARKEGLASTGSCPHCHEKSCAAVAVKADKPAEKSCCKSPRPEKRERLKVALVIVDLARSCQGLSKIWTILSASLPAVSPVRWSVDWVVVGYVVERPTSTPTVDLSPPLPPPKLTFPRA